MFRSKPIALVTLMSALAASAFTATGASAATPEPWSATGTGTTTTTSDGTSSDPVLDYSVNGESGAWKFSATAGPARVQRVDWRYKGYHAWYQVRVAIEKFVIRNGTEIVTESLRSAGPVNCCASPSGSFDYTGTTTFDLKAGDVYGFRMSGGHGDSDKRLIGTLSLSMFHDFSIQRPSAARVTAGQTATTTISTAVTSGAAQPLSLSISCRNKAWNEGCHELPAGWSASFSPTTVTAGGTSTLTVTIPATERTGNYYLPIEATGPNSTRRTEFPVIVERAPCSMSTLDSYFDDYTNAHDRLAGALFEERLELREAATAHYRATGVVVDCLMKIVDEQRDR